MAEGAFLRELLLELLEREVLFPGLNSDVEPVFPRGERAHVVIAVGAVWAVRAVEIELVLVAWTQGKIEVARGTVGFLPARPVAEGDEQVVLSGFRPDGLVGLEAPSLPLDCELEVTPLQHIPRRALARHEDDGLRIRVSNEREAEPVGGVGREVRELDEFVSQDPWDGGVRVFLEELVLLPPLCLESLHVCLVRLLRQSHGRS